MRAIRALTVAKLALLATLVALDVGVAEAQPTRGFKDSWFWGAKAGGMFYQVQSDTDYVSFAPFAGADWLITRTNGGLYVSYDRSFFSQFVFVNDSVSPLDTVPRQVNLRGMHRFTLAGMLFPLQTYRMHPYVGFGFSLNHIASAEAVGTYRNGTQQGLVLSTIEQFRTASSPLVILGSQFRVPLVSAFAQVSVTRSTNNFFLYTGSGWRTTVEGGVRYNIGSSIERMR